MRLAGRGGPAPHGRRTSRPGEAAPPGLGLLLLLGPISTIAAISIEMYLPALPQIAADLHARPGGVELTISAFLIALAGGQLVYGPLSDRFGRRRPLCIGLAIYCVASAGCALAQSVEQLVVLRFVQAIGGSSGAVIVRAVLRDRFPAQRLVHTLATLSLITGLAPLLAPLAGGEILRVAPWRAILWVQTAFGAGIGLAAFSSLRESAPPARGDVWGSLVVGYRAVLKSRRTMGYALTNGFSGAVIFIYGAMFPAVAMKGYGLSAATFSWILAGSAAAMMAGAQLNRPLLRRFTGDRVLQTANLCSILIAAVLCATAWSGAGGFLGLLIPLVCLMGLRGMTIPNSAAAALLSQERNAGVVSALVGAQSFAWGAVLSALASRFADGTARPMAATILLSCLLSAIVLRGVALPTSATQPAAERSEEPAPLG